MTMQTLKNMLLLAALLPATLLPANSGIPRTDGFYRAQGSGDKVESAKVYWIKFTGQVMLLEMYNTEGQKLREYFKYSEYKFFSLKTAGSDAGTSATGNLHDYKITMKGDKLQVSTIKGDKLPGIFVFVPEVDAQAERKGISKTPNISAQEDNKESTGQDQQPKKKKKKCCKHH